MGRAEAIEGSFRPGRPGPGIALIHGLAMVSAGGVVALTGGWNRWSVVPMVVIGAFAVGSDLTSVHSDSSKIKFSGTLLTTVLASVRYGGAPAAVIGLLAIAVGWFRWREAPHYLRNNLVTYAWFPLASGLFFGAATRLLHVGPHDAGYYFLVLPTFGVALIVNFLGVAGYQCYLDRVSLSHKLREVAGPVLAAELFSAVLTTAAVYFVTKNGTIGIVVLMVTLAIFQYLVGELLTSQRRARELQRRATTDDLTGLANREQFCALLKEELGAGRLAGSPTAVMLIDLDRFKDINDTLGHHYGDAILRDLSPRLAACVGSAGIAARLGGDEFAVVPAQRTDDPDTLGRIATRLLECVQEPIVIEQMTLEIGASIGVARAPLDGEDVHSLLRRADVAMYAAKEELSGHRIYHVRLDRHSRRRLTVLSDFRRALDGGELVVHYQPIVDIVTSRTCGAEGLVRWQHPELGLVAPADLIPIAEQSGLIGLLTRQVLDRSIAQCAEWRAAGEDLTIAVNLSVRDLLDRELPDQIDSLLVSHGLAPDAMQLEITESMIVSDPDRALRTVAQLRELGLRVAIDDFGTGYASLANVKRLPVDELKIDRSFISELSRDESDQIIVRSTINLGHDLGLTVVAEGVEDEPTLNRLRLLGCDLAQGYHLSRPLAADAFAEWLGLGEEAAPDWVAASLEAVAPERPVGAALRAV
jgi:diguanylate cyclase (GGDEF)-like protein